MGLASAEAELAEKPELLDKGFYDPASLLTEMRQGAKFLVLGQKGSGKSAIACKLVLQARTSSDLFVNHIHLRDFPFTDFGQIVTGRDEVKFPASWKYLLSILLYRSFALDNGSNAFQDEDIFEATRQLERLGLISDASLAQVVRKSKSNHFKASLPVGIGNISVDWANDSSSKIIELAELLIHTARKFRSQSYHLIFIDGLDDVLISNPSQLAVLGALVLEVDRLNRVLRDGGSPIKVVVLCRSDLYERMSNPNKNKIRQDYGIQLDWYHNPREPSNSKLIALANQRASIVRKDIEDFFTLFMQPYFRVDDYYEDVRHYLLDMTRHTPRDFLQLITHILRFYASDGKSRDSFMAGLRSYSQNYFLPEIKDELDGFCSEGHVKLTLRTIRSLSLRDFRLDQLVELAGNEHRDAMEDVLSQLYEAGAVGNVIDRPGGSHFFTFKFRNPETEFDSRRRITLHRGMLKAMNMV